MSKTTFSGPVHSNAGFTGPAAGSTTLAAATTLTAADSGKTYFLNLAGGFTVTLPAESAGLNFRFIVAVAPTTAYIIACDGGNDTIVGAVHESSGGDGDSESTAGGDQVNFVANTAVIGDEVNLISDGTLWYARAFCDAAGGITITG